MRLVFIAQLDTVDITWTYVSAGIWTAAEPSIAVTSASLPILRSLWVWKQRKRSASRESDEPGEGASRGNNSFYSRKIGSVDSQNYPLNELPASHEPKYGTQTTIYAHNQRPIMPRDQIGENFADLPIMMPRDVVRPSAALQPPDPWPSPPPNRSELAA